MGLSPTKMYSHTSLGTSGVAPLLTWTTGTADPTPDFQVDYIDVIVGDVVTFQFSQSSGFGSGITTVTNTLDSSEVLAATITETLSSPLADGAWYARAKVTRSGRASPWSNTVSKTLNSAPYMTSAATANCNSGAQLAFTLTASQSSTFAITGGADSAKFEISGSTLRWLSNGTQDFSAPADVGTNNVYDVQVTPTAVADSEAGSAQSIAITVLFVIVDTDAATYINALIAAGTTPNATKQGAIDAFFIGCKSDSVYTLFNDAGIYVWGAAAANAIKVKGGTASTFVGGVAHNAGYIQLSSNGYINTKMDSTPFTTSGAMIGFLIPPSVGVTTTVAGYDCGMANGSNQRYEIASYWTDNNCYANLTVSSNTAAAGSANAGLVLSNRYAAANIETTRYDGSNNAQGTSVQTTAYSGSSGSAHEMYVGGRNSGGAINSPTNRAYSLAITGPGMAPADRALLQARIWTLMTALGGI